jgi:SsrA-binding protein
MAPGNKEARRYTEVRNSKALHEYFVDERFEAGIQLRGTEVKSVRGGKAQICGAFGRAERGEVWLLNSHIEPYEFGTNANHDARRPRKLLLHRHQIRKISEALAAGGRALVPLRLYFKDALVKVEIALCTGKKLFDKRETIRKKSEMREISRAMRNRGA